MHAEDLATEYPTVRMETNAVDAVRTLTQNERPALIVVNEQNHPIAVLSGSQVLRMVIPRYVQDDPTLARVVDEEGDRSRVLGAVSVSQLLGRVLPDL